MQHMHTNNLWRGVWTLQQLPNAVRRLRSRQAKLLLRKGKDKEKTPNDPLNYTQVLHRKRERGEEREIAT